MSTRKDMKEGTELLTLAQAILPENTHHIKVVTHIYTSCTLLPFFSHSKAGGHDNEGHQKSTPDLPKKPYNMYLHSHIN